MFGQLDVETTFLFVISDPFFSRQAEYEHCPMAVIYVKVEKDNYGDLLVGEP